MSRDKAKTYYIHDKTNEVLFDSLTKENVIDMIVGNFLKDDISYNIFEYGVLESRGAGFRLQEKYNVNDKFKINNNKMTFVG